MRTPRSQSTLSASPKDLLRDGLRMGPDEKHALGQAVNRSLEEQSARKMAIFGLPESMDDIFCDEGSGTDLEETASSQD